MEGLPDARVQLVVADAAPERGLVVQHGRRLRYQPGRRRGQPGQVWNIINNITNLRVFGEILINRSEFHIILFLFFYYQTTNHSTVVKIKDI